MKHAPFTCTIERLTPEGKGHLQYKDKDLFVIGALPGETCLVRITKKRRSYREAVVEEVLETPYERKVTVEDHFLSCSPWQPLPYSIQIEQKTKMLRHAYQQHQVELSKEIIDQMVVHGAPEDQRLGYRTKMEYSFWYDDEAMRLAFHQRGKPFIKTPLLEGCILAADKVNQCGLRVVELLDRHGINKNDLKTLTIRESKTTGDVLAILLQKNPDLRIPITLSDLAPFAEGLTIATSPPRSPAAIIEEVQYQEGITALTEEIIGTAVSYPLDGFFQNHIGMFSNAVSRMKAYLKDEGTRRRMVELYSGVGTIGLALAAFAEEVVGIEISSSMVQMAQENARQNNISHYTAHLSPAEQMPVDLLQDTDTLILDPPRAGLHQDVVKMIRTALPAQILYLSCNPATQARDVALLASQYRLYGLEGFDFYPQTLHMEGLAVLERR
ncbi:MAG: class I SAM-dependent RNA methyltransferase [Patescibacteria group bacterium]